MKILLLILLGASASLRVTCEVVGRQTVGSASHAPATPAVNSAHVCFEPASGPHVEVATTEPMPTPILRYVDSFVEVIF